MLPLQSLLILKVASSWRCSLNISSFSSPSHYPCFPTAFTKFHKGQFRDWRNLKNFSFILTFSVVCLFNHLFTVKVLVPLSLTFLGTKLMTVMKYLASKDEKTWANQNHAELSGLGCASPLGSAWECQVAASPFTSYLHWCGGCAEDSGAEVGFINCMAVWISLSILFPCRIPVIVIRWLSLPNVSCIAVTFGVCFFKKGQS